MRWLVVIAVAFGVACSGGTPSPGHDGGDNDDGDPGTPSALHYIGRFTADQRSDWSGSGVVARFSGTGVSVAISGSPNRFEAFIDGMHAATFDSPAASFSIADHLQVGEHLVEVYRRSEAIFGDTTFEGFTITDGALTKSPFPFAHRLQFVGDSISCGYGDLGVNGTCDLDLDTESELVAYGALTAHALNAAHHVIAWSGKGMWRQFGDTSPPSPEQMPELYERTIASEAASTWDHTQYVPDVIVVNLGTNDWNTGDPGQPYENAYVAFLTHLRSLYAEAHIFCTLGPMQDSAPALQHVQNVVSAMNDTRVHYLAFPVQQESDGLGCDYHPSQTTHQKMATQLETAIRGVTSW